MSLSPKHIVDSVCSCQHCTMIDCMWGDPQLNLWEAKFVKNVAHRGWIADYSDKQKSKILQIFTKRKMSVENSQKYSHSERS